MPITNWVLVRQAATAQGAERRAAFASLFSSYSAPLRRELCSRGFDAVRVEDATQLLFTDLLDDKKRLSDDLAKVREGKGSFGSWLMTTSYRAFLNLLRYERRKVRGGGSQHVGLDHPAARVVADGARTSERPGDEEAKELVVRRAYEHVRARYSAPHEVAFVDAVYRFLSEGSRIDLGAFRLAFAQPDATLRQRKRRIIEVFRERLLHEGNLRFPASDCIEEELQRLAMLFD